MTTETKVEAAAWLVTSGDARVICMSEATADAQAFELRKGGYPANIEKLIPASAITALEGEVDRLRKSNELYSFAMNPAGIDELKRRADAAERRGAELERACKPIIEKSIAISKTTSSVFTSDLRRLLAALTKESP
jgi:hypothetical protein